MTWILSLLINVIMWPFIHFQARSLKKSKEWKDSEAKMKELNVKSEKLRMRFDQLIKQYKKDYVDNAKEFGKSKETN